MTEVNATHNPALRSWVESANVLGTDFPIQNLPFCVFKTKTQASARCGVAIGDQIVDIRAITELFNGEAAAAAHACDNPVLNDLMGLGSGTASALRHQLSQLLSTNSSSERERIRQALAPIADAELLLPLRVAGFTDFFASVHHATNAGRLFRPDQPLLPNYKYVPVAYNGRANSVRVSGAPIVRPRGQQRPTSAETPPAFAPSARLDYEVELGIVIGEQTHADKPVPTRSAWRHVFGFCLLNDWSARDIQAWEYQPLGPFLAKTFATSISPWIVTTEALAPFRTAAAERPHGDPAPLPHLHDADDQSHGGVAIKIDASLRSARMRELGSPPYRLSRSNSSTLYWTVAQMVAHHTSNGSTLDTADLLGSGTISGPSDDALGSLLEITAGGSRPLTLPSDEQRTFLADGDEIILSGYCERTGFVRIGFGECRATLLPSLPYPEATS